MLQARRLSQHAAAFAERQDQKQAAAQWLLHAARRDAEVGDAASTRELVTTALRLSASADSQILAAVATARSGDFDRAAALAADVARQLPHDTSVQRYWLPTIQAAIALARNDPAAAIESLRAASGYELGMPSPEPGMGGTLYPVYLRGEAYLQLHRPAE